MKEYVFLVLGFGLLIALATAQNCGQALHCTDCQAQANCSWCLQQTGNFSCVDSSATFTCQSPPVNRCDCLAVWEANGNCTDCENLGCVYCSDLYLGGPPMCRASTAECQGAEIDCNCASAGSCSECQQRGCEYCGGSCVSAGRCQADRIDFCECNLLPNCSACAAANCNWCVQQFAGATPFCANSYADLFNCIGGILIQDGVNTCAKSQCNLIQNCSACVETDDCFWCAQTYGPGACAPREFLADTACAAVYSTEQGCACSATQSCGACIRNENDCRWCSGVSSCLPNSLAFESQITLDSIVGIDDCKCANESLVFDCVGCVEAGCLFQQSNGYCAVKGDIETPRQCGLNSNCTSIFSCEECLSTPECVYCEGSCLYNECGASFEQSFTCPLPPSQGPLCSNFTTCDSCIATPGCAPVIQVTQGAVGQQEWGFSCYNQTGDSLMMVIDSCPATFDEDVVTYRRCMMPTCTVCLAMDGCIWSDEGGLCMPDGWAQYFPNSHFTYSLTDCCHFISTSTATHSLMEKFSSAALVLSIFMLFLLVAKIGFPLVFSGTNADLGAFTQTYSPLVSSSTPIIALSGAIAVLSLTYSTLRDNTSNFRETMPTMFIWKVVFYFIGIPVLFGFLIGVVLLSVTAINSIRGGVSRKISSLLLRTTTSISHFHLLLWSQIHSVALCIFGAAMQLPFQTLRVALVLTTAILSFAIAASASPPRADVIKISSIRGRAAKIYHVLEGLRRPLLFVTPLGMAICTYGASPHTVALFSLQFEIVEGCRQNPLILKLSSCSVSEYFMEIWGTCLVIGAVTTLMNAVVGIELRHAVSRLLDGGREGGAIMEPLNASQRGSETDVPTLSSRRFGLSQGLLLPLVLALNLSSLLLLIMTGSVESLNEGRWVSAMYAFVMLTTFLSALLTLSLTVALGVQTANSSDILISLMDHNASMRLPILPTSFQRYFVRPFRTWLGRIFIFLINFTLNVCYFSYRVSLPLDSTSRKATLLPNLGALILSILGVLAAAWSVLVFTTRHRGILPLSLSDVNYRIATAVSLCLLLVKTYLVGITINFSSSIDNTILFLLFLTTFLLLSAFGFSQLYKLSQKKAQLLSEIRNKNMFLFARVLNWFWVRIAIIFMAWAVHFRPVLILIPLSVPFGLLSTIVVVSSMLDNEVAMFSRVRDSVTNVSEDETLSSEERSRLSLSRTVHSTRNLKVICSIVSLLALDAAAAQLTLQISTYEVGIRTDFVFRPAFYDTVSSQGLAMAILLAQFIISSLLYASI